MNLRSLSVAGFFLAVAALIVLVYSDQVWGTGPVTIGLQVVAALLMIWARITFGMRSFHAAANPTAGGLVTNGPYAWVRNPIYSAVQLFGWSAAAAHPSALSCVCALAITAGMLVRVFAEERALREHFGSEYTAYSTRVKRLVPFVF